MAKIKKVLIFPNGNIAVFDDKGKQVPKLQQPWLNFAGLRELAQAIVKDKPVVQGILNIPTDALEDYIHFYEQQRTNHASK